MSGPIATDAAPVPETLREPTGPVVEVAPARATQVGTMPVRRLLPQRPRRTVGAWCFADHAGPVSDGAGDGGIGPHPHMGLQTVTWLLEGELHLDSLGSEQPIRPGQLNLMTAGHGVAHAEEDPGRSSRLHLVQLWVAQPVATRDGAPAFEHHTALPQVELDGGSATVLVGEFAGTVAAARRDTDHMGAELVLRPPGALMPLRRDYEYALIVLDGGVTLRVPQRWSLARNRAGNIELGVEPGRLAYLGPGRDELAFEVTEASRALLLGGVPFSEPVLMWWNFVARDRDEVSEARREWTARDERFGEVRSNLPRMEVAPPPWE